MVNIEIRMTIFFTAKDREALYSLQKQDLELTVAQIMSSLLQNSDLKKVGKTTRPLRYDQNQIHFNYTVEVTNRLEGLDLIDRVPKELWKGFHNIVPKPSPRKRHATRQNGCLRRPYK